ncbi:MAG: tail fiber protein [Roseiflexaceae bacterium]
MTTPMIAEIRMFAGNFAPRSWAFCQGQILSIAQNTALFSLLGTTYGGNGQTTFALPDFRGRVPVGTGQGPGLPSVNLGEMSGSPTHTLIITEMPAHNHVIQSTLNGTSATANSGNPGDSIPATSSSLSLYISSSVNPPLNRPFASTVISNVCNIAGGSQPFSIMQPYLGMNFIIAVEGVYPARN